MVIRNNFQHNVLIRNEGHRERNEMLIKCYFLTGGLVCDLFNTKVWEVLSGNFYLSRIGIYLAENSSKEMKRTCIADKS